MKHRVLRVLAISGSIMAFHVGSGFASGQEVLQFYTAYGREGGLWMCLVSFLFFFLFSFTILEQGRLYPKTPLRGQYLAMGGRVVGNAFYFITPVLLVLVLIVTLSGAGASVASLFGWKEGIGRAVMTVCVLLTVLLGLGWITGLAGSMGPIIIVCALVLGVCGMLQRCPDSSLWESLPHTSGTWLLSALSYACFGTITQIPFLLTVGEKLSGRRESAVIAALGNGGYVLAGAVLHLGLYRSLALVWGEQIPALRLARQVSLLAGFFYGIILLFSIYTTAVPMLWSVCKSIQPDEKSASYRISALLLAPAAACAACLPFDRLLGVVYPYIGYLSAVFFTVLLLRALLHKNKAAVRPSGGTVLTAAAKKAR